MTKIYMIEGLPGSGKTTFSKKLEQHFLELNQPVIRYSEGDLHPVDLAWCSITDKETFQKLCDRYVDVKDQILNLTKVVNGEYITAYTNVKINKQYKDFYDVFGGYEIYRSNDLMKFKEKHLSLYNEFSKNFEENTVYIFECIFLQNHINELILKHNLSFKEMKMYFNDLIQALSPIKPTIFYINQQNIEERINYIVNERKTDDPTLYKDWIDLVLEYMEKTPYAKILNYLQYDGFIRYLKDRKHYELSILENLNTNKHIIDLDDDFNEVFNTILSLV